MFNFRLENTSVFKSVFTGLDKIIDEFILECDQDGVMLKALDKSHITFIHLELENQFFDEYYCPEPVRVNVDATEFNTVLKRCKPSDVMECSVNDANFEVRFIGDAKRIFCIRLLDLEYETPAPPTIDYNVTFDLPFSLFRDCLKDIVLYSDKIRFSVVNEKLIITGEGDFGELCIDYFLNTDFGTSVSSMFSVEKLEHLVKADKISDKVNLGLGEEMPLSINYKDTGINLGFILAPRLEVDEEI